MKYIGKICEIPIKHSLFSDFFHTGFQKTKGRRKRGIMLRDDFQFPTLCRSEQYARHTEAEPLFEQISKKTTVLQDFFNYNHQ